jgi:hypothetical protein
MHDKVLMTSSGHMFDRPIGILYYLTCTFDVEKSIVLKQKYGARANTTTNSSTMCCNTN